MNDFTRGIEAWDSNSTFGQMTAWRFRRTFERGSKLEDSHVSLQLPDPGLARRRPSVRRLLQQLRDAGLRLHEEGEAEAVDWETLIGG